MRGKRQQVAARRRRDNVAPRRYVVDRDKDARMPRSRPGRDSRRCRLAACIRPLTESAVQIATRESQLNQAWRGGHLRRPGMKATSRAGNDPAASRKRQFNGGTTLSSTDRPGAGTASIHDVSALPAPPRRERATTSRSTVWRPRRLTIPVPLWKPPDSGAPRRHGPYGRSRGSLRDRKGTAARRPCQVPGRNPAHPRRQHDIGMAKHPGQHRDRQVGQRQQETGGFPGAGDGSALA